MVKMHDEIREQIVKLLPEHRRQISDIDSLVISGLLNSVKVIELATWLEEKYHIDFDAHSFHVRNFDSVNAVVKLVESKK